MKHRLFSVRELCYIALFAAVIAISAWIAVPAAIPFTMQTFAVFLTVGLLGAKCAVTATLIYILLGAVGLPVFAGFGGGVGVLFSVNGGFIIGFAVSALISGKLLKSFGRTAISTALCMLCGMLACYLFGCAWFAVLNRASLFSVLLSCALPYIPFDLIKIALAALISVKARKYICLK